MSNPPCVDSHHVASIRQVLGDVTDVLEILADGCDRDELNAIVAKATAELERARPNVATLSTHLNSLARSLRAEPNARTVVMELDAAMHAARIPTNWEH